MTDFPVPATFGLVLAGGLARRMGGGDKARSEIGGVTILDRVLATLSGQVQGMVQHEAQRHPLVLGPGQRLAEGGLLPGGDIGQIPLPGAQRFHRQSGGLGNGLDRVHA